MSAPALPAKLNKFYMLHDAGLVSVTHDEVARTLAFDVRMSSDSNDEVGWFGVFTFYDVALVEAAPSLPELQALLSSPDYRADVAYTQYHPDQDGGVVVWIGSFFGRTRQHVPPYNEYVFQLRTSGFTWEPDRTRPNPYPHDPTIEPFWRWVAQQRRFKKRLSRLRLRYHAYR